MSEQENRSSAPQEHARREGDADTEPEGLSPASAGHQPAPPGTPSSGTGERPGASEPPSTARTPDIAYRRPQYMISPRQSPGFQTLSADIVVQQLRDSPDITLVRTIAPPRLLALQSAEGPGLSELVLARMKPEKAQLLAMQGGERLMVERDPPLTFALDPAPPEMRLPNPGVLVPHASGFRTTIEVQGTNGPLPNAEVFVFGSVWPTQAKTDARGRAEVSITGESPDTIRSLYVKPHADHWSLWLDRPALVPDAVNTVHVKPLAATVPDFPDRELLGWGMRAMGLDAVPPSYNGAGVKIAVIDSGAARDTHRNLRNVGPGVSVVGEDRGAWTDDTIGHGSHCAGVIAGRSPGSASGIRGFAPAAEIHVCRIFPGGRFSDLVSALDYCMENGIDVVNMSLGGGEPSRIIEERLVKAKAMGIACIVAAGNSAGPVQFPASTPHVLAVGAMGQWGEFPEDSYHAKQVLEGFASRDGYFPASFSCFGPEIDVCAPGVAIISTLPPDGFGAWDGTSMAAPHVTGLAALILAHHPDFRGAFRARDARRVERLFEIVKQSATPLGFGDPTRTGAGLPNAPRALGLAEPVRTAAASTQQVPEASVAALKDLLALLVGSGGAGQAAARPMSASAPAGTSAMSLQSAVPSFGAPVARGPAWTGNGGRIGSDCFGRLSGTDLSTLRNAMRQAGLLP